MAPTSSAGACGPIDGVRGPQPRWGEWVGRSSPGAIGRRLTGTVLGTTALAVALACVGFAIHQVRSSRATLIHGLESVAEMIGYNAMLPLVARDPAPVEATLLALTSNEAVEAAAVYDGDGALFARFARNYDAAPVIPESAPAPGTRSEADSVILARAIEAGGQTVGTVVLRVSTDPLRRQLAGNALVAAGAFVICLAPALFATARLRRELSVPLAALAASAERVSAGDFRARVALARNDEIGVLGEAFDEMAERLRALIAEVTTSAREVLGGMKTLGEASRRSREQAHTQRASVDRTSAAIERTESSLEAVGKATHKLAECTGTTAASADEVEASTRNVRESIDLLFELIEETASALTESVESIRQVGANADHLDSASERASHSVDELAASVASVGDAASRGLALSEETAEGAERGHRAVLETMDAIAAIDSRFGALHSAIADLAKRGAAIEGVVEVIDKVAAETNLLSLNASIVASQAGDQGRAFAVVASRIGALAERTSRLTGEIGGLVRSVQGSTQVAVQAAREGSESVAVGVKLSREAGEVLSRIMAAAAESAQDVKRIADAATEQGSALGGVGSAFREVREGLLQIRGAVQEQSGATNRLNGNMQRTKEIADRVQRATGEQATAVSHITRTIQEIHVVTDQVREVTETQSNDARQILRALELFREIAGRNVEDAQSVQRVVDQLGQRAEALGLSLGGLQLDETEEKWS
jgi:methyl-accepting chemotaxis protein